jgi:hypothetical protein
MPGFFSSLAGLLGITPNVAGTSQRQSAQQYLSAAGNNANTYAGVASQAGSNYGANEPAYQTALNTEVDTLGQGFGNQARSGYIAGQTANVGNQYQQGAANLTDQLSARGLGTSGSVAGGLADLNSQRSGAYANAANAANNYFSTAQAQRQGQITGLLGQAAGTDYSQQMGALGGATNADLGVAGIYGNEATQAQQQQAQQDQAFQQGIGGLFGDIGSIYGLRSGMASMTPSSGAAPGGPSGPYNIGGDPSGGNTYGYSYAGY